MKLNRIDLWCVHCVKSRRHISSKSPPIFYSPAISYSERVHILPIFSAFALRTQNWLQMGEPNRSHMLGSRSNLNTWGLDFSVPPNFYTGEKPPDFGPISEGATDYSATTQKRHRISKIEGAVNMADDWATMCIHNQVPPCTPLKIHYLICEFLGKICIYAMG